MKPHEELTQCFEATLNRLSYQRLTPLPLIQSFSEQPYFSFSPILNVVDALVAREDHPPCYVTQLCFRSRDRYKFEYSPIGTYFQKLFSVFDIIAVPYSKIVQTVTQLLEAFRLKRENVYWLVPEEYEAFAAELKTVGWGHVWPSNMKSAVCTIPRVERSSHYVRVLYRFGNGLVPIGNMVLIGAQNGSASLDSIFFLDRLTFIHEEKESVLDTYLFRPIQDLLDKCVTLSRGERRSIPNILRATGALVNAGLTPGPKKAQYVVRKLIRDFLTCLLISKVEITEDLLRAFSEQTVQCLSLYDDQFLSQDAEILTGHIIREHYIFTQNFKTQASVIRKKLNQILANGEVSFELIRDLSSTYGVPFEILIQLTWELGNVEVINPDVVKYRIKLQPYPYVEQAHVDLKPWEWYRMSPFFSDREFF